MTTVISGSSPSITFSDSTTQTTAFTSTPSVTTITTTSDATISGLTVGKGGGAVSTSTAVGASALTANTTGGNNVAIGYQAGLAQSTGGQSTFVGSQAGLAGADIDYATAVGYQAMSSITTGDFNTALGAQALKSNTTASNGVAVGYQASYSRTTGDSVVAIGKTAGYSGVSSVSSTFVGTNAGYYSTGSYNTFLGQGAGEAITSGTKNTIIGRYDGNIGGYDIRTASNWIVLSDGDGNPAIYNRPAGASAASGKNTTVFGMLDAPASGETVTVNCNNNSAASASYGIIVSGRPSDVTVNAMRFYNANASTIVGSIQINPTTTTYATSSDYRLKENIAPMTGALATVAQLKPVTYKWKQDGSDGQGFIAHELQEVMPDAVVGKKDAVDEDGKPIHQGIDTSFLVATLTAAIQELKTIVDAQAAEIAELKAKVG